MPTRIAVLRVLLATMPAAAAAMGSESVDGGRSLPDWSVTVGAGALVVPSYPGASSSKLMRMPFVEVKYRQAFFLSPHAGLGFNAVATRRVQAGVALLPELGRSASSSDRLRGWGELDAGASIKVFGRYSLGPVAVAADVRRQVRAGNGTLVGAGLTTMLPLARRLAVMPTLKVTWANARHSRAYFGIDGDQSATALVHGTSLPVYSAGAGLRDAGLSLLGSFRLDDRWSVHALFRAEVLLGDAAGSPLVERRFQGTAGAWLAFRL